MFTIDPVTHVISIPKTDLTLVSGTLYNYDTDVFRLQLKDWEDSDEGIWQPNTHNHNTEVTIAGVTYARFVEILSPYSVEFEDGQYSVILVGSNNNIWDIASGILVQNQVQVIPTNSAGLITVVSGSGVTAQDKIDIANLTWAELIEGTLTAEQMLRVLLSIAVGKTTITDLGGDLATVKFRDLADSKDRVTASMDGSERTNIVLDGA